MSEILMVFLKSLFRSHLFHSVKWCPNYQSSLKELNEGRADSIVPFRFDEKKYSYKVFFYFREV